MEIQIHFQLGKKKHLSPPVRRHIPVTEFPNPGWGFNPFNWDLGGIWTVQYRSGKKMNILIDKTFLDSTQEKAFLCWG